MYREREIFYSFVNETERRRKRSRSERSSLHRFTYLYYIGEETKKILIINRMDFQLFILNCLHLTLCNSMCCWICMTQSWLQELNFQTLAPCKVYIHKTSLPSICDLANIKGRRITFVLCNFSFLLEEEGKVESWSFLRLFLRLPPPQSYILSPTPTCIIMCAEWSLLFWTSWTWQWDGRWRWL